MLKKSIVGAAALALSTLALAPAAFAQLPEPIEALGNPLAVGAVNYLNDAPADGSSRYRFLLTTNIAGVKPLANVPLYIGGIGVDIRTLPELGGIGQSTGAGLSIPGLTYMFAGGQAALQVGYSMAFNESAASGVYAGFGFGLTSQTTMRQKRIEKAKKKAERMAEENARRVAAAQ